MNMIAKTLAKCFGVGLIIIGIAGVIPNGAIGAEGFLETDMAGNAIHIAFGLLLLANSFKGESTAAMGHFLVAGLSFLLAAVGYKAVGNYGRALVFDIVQVSPILNYFHAGLACSLAVCGMLNTSSRQLIRD